MWSSETWGRVWFKTQMFLQRKKKTPSFPSLNAWADFWQNLRSSGASSFIRRVCSECYLSFSICYLFRDAQPDPFSASSPPSIKFKLTFSSVNPRRRVKDEASECAARPCRAKQWALKTEKCARCRLVVCRLRQRGDVSSLTDNRCAFRPDEKCREDTLSPKQEYLWSVRAKCCPPLGQVTEH